MNDFNRKYNHHSSNSLHPPSKIPQTCTCKPKSKQRFSHPQYGILLLAWGFSKSVCSHHLGLALFFVAVAPGKLFFMKLPSLSKCESETIFEEDFVSVGDWGLGVRQVLSVKAPKGCTNQPSSSGWSCHPQPSCCSCASLHVPCASVGSGLWALAQFLTPVYQLCLHLL